MSFVNDLISTLSGQNAADVNTKLLFNSVIGFRGIVEGVGCSTIVADLAHAFSDRTGKSVCVVDTSILYPTQYALLCNPFSSDVKASLKDWFSSEVSIPERIIDTKYKRVSLLGCYNRRLADAFSSSDTTKLAEDTFDRLKELFDVVLVDLSHEWSQIAMTSAIQCNKIYNVVDLSPRCINNLPQSLNNLASSAVPFSKFRSTIINKYSVRGVLGIDDVIKKHHLEVVSTIPFSEEVFVLGTQNRSCWAVSSLNYELERYNEELDKILCSIVNETPLEIIDLKEAEELELAVENSGIKNKSKARKIEIRKRNPLLTPTSDEEKKAIKEKRKADIKKRSQEAEEPEDEPIASGDEPVDLGFGEFDDSDARMNAEDVEAVEAGKKSRGLNLHKKGV